MAHRTPPSTPTPDLFELWRAATLLAQQLDEILLTIEFESFDFVLMGRARRWQHKVVRALAGRLASGRAIAKASALAEPHRASDKVIKAA
jgi:hypothetical protein